MCLNNGHWQRREVRMPQQQITVIGSGVMGRGIAYVAALNGFFVKLHDIDKEALRKAQQENDSLFKKGLQRGKISEAEKKKAEDRLFYEANLENAVNGADLIIEAVPEQIEMKRNVFRQLDKFAKKDCVLATNTSTMSPTEIGSFTNRPHAVVAMHFFNPVHQMQLIEIVKGMETSEQTVAFVKNAAARMGKETVIINEFPGFVTSRLSALIGNEAFYMLQEGIGTPEEIDKAVKLGLHYPMGPFELADLVGLDTRLYNLQYLHEKLGEKYRPAPLLEKYVKAGRLGRKTGRGVYDY